MNICFYWHAENIMTYKTYKDKEGVPIEVIVGTRYPLNDAPLHMYIELLSHTVLVT